MNKVVSVILLFLIFTFLSISIFCVWIFKSNFLKLNIEEESKILLIEKGDTLRRLANKIEAEEFYNKPFVALIVLKFIIGEAPLHVGEYEIIKNSSVLDLADKIKNKDYYYRKITFIEGDTIAKYKEQINSAYGLTGEITVDVKEGYFMPATYNYLYGETKNSILQRGNEDMIKFVNTELEKIENKAEFYLKTIHEILTLASVVEKESAIGIERDLIAGVFFNRLKKGMRLQSDPTTIYEITKGKYKLDRPLTRTDLTMMGEYNTYYVKALPVAPIASPSKESIIAVLNPKETDKIFFVADGLGGHNFSISYEEHKENIKKYKEVLNSSNETK